MAKRRKHHPAPRRRSRRRMSGITHGTIANTGAEALGVLIGTVGGGVIQKQFTAINPKIMGAAQVVVGMMLKSHAKGNIMRGVGWGLFSSGVLGIAQNFHIISGVDDFVSGIDNQSYISGPDDMSGADDMSGLMNEYQVVSGLSGMSGAMMNGAFVG